jgi:hypothetical protein
MIDSDSDQHVDGASGVIAKDFESSSTTSNIGEELVFKPQQHSAKEGMWC